MKNRKDIEDKIAAREAEVRSISDDFNVKQAQFQAGQQKALEAFQQYAAQTQQRASHIEGMVMQLREDLAALPAEDATPPLPEEPALT